MHMLPFGKVYADDLSLDLSTHDDDGPDAGQIDRYVVLGDHSGDDWRRRGYGAGIVGAPNIEGVVEVPIVVDGLGPSVPIIEGDALGVGTTTKGLPPALSISTDPNGIPVQATYRLAD
jgi:hypothetical protein